MTRGRGWLPDDPETIAQELRSKHLAGLVGALTPIDLSSVDHTLLLDKIQDQGATSSCVGQAFSTAFLLTARILWDAPTMSIPRPSAKAIYDFARLEDQPYEALRDDGSRPLAAMRCLVEKGAVLADAWPLTSSNVNVPPPLDVYEAALGAKVGSYYRIAPGPGASLLVRHALARGYCPVFAMQVDEAYEGWASERIYEGRTGPSLGGHMQAIAGFGDGFLRVVNSWGPDWGDRGMINLGVDYFDSGECEDILVMTVVPSLKGG